MDVNDSQIDGCPPVAIISVGCFFPHASGFKAYWHLLYHGKDAIADIPPTHWSPDDYYDEDPRKPDHVYCRRGGFLSPIPFDPTAFGIPPANLEATDTSQILALVAAKAALAQAGYDENAEFDRDRTAVVLGVTGTQELVIPLSSRLGWPKWKKALEAAGVGADQAREVMNRLSGAYVAWQENSFPGLLGNVVAGRISNRLDLGGTNCVVDAACASSMSAINLALMELYTGKARMVVTGGVDTLNDIFMHMCFARTQILSPTGDARPFSRKADGTVLGEGIGILIMKRLEDAEADGDRILAVLKGIGSSSDGKSQSIYAPRAEGQLKALRKAYAAAEVAPETVGLIEAHGTGTRVGDKIEIQALTRLLGARNRPLACALGSVKSMIGHTKAAAGAAGLIKAVLALHHKVLPPTLKAEDPDPDLQLEDTAFYLNRQARPWFRNGATPRRAGVSAFGFGGSNFHAVLEEHDSRKIDVAWDGSVEIVALAGRSAPELQEILQTARTALLGTPPEDLPQRARAQRAAFDGEAAHRLLLVLTREEDTRGPRWNTDVVFDEAAQGFGANPGAAFWQTRTCFYGSGPRPGRLAFLFPGQGSQYVGMARDLVAWFPEAMETLETASRHFTGGVPLVDLIYPPPIPANGDPENEAALRHTAAAQPAIGAVSVAMAKILHRFGVAPEATCGHSYGELTALYSAGRIDEETLHALSALRGKLMAEAGGDPGTPNGTMLAVKAPLEALDRLLETEGLDVVLANRNSPDQGVLSGATESIRLAETACKAHKYRTVRLPVSAAFHSRLVEGARAPFAEALKTVVFKPSKIPVYSNTTGAAYPSAPEAVRKLLGGHLRNPVDFIGDVEALYRSEHRIFVEVGPKTVLTGLVRAILKGRDFHARAMDAGGGKAFAVADLANLLCWLASLGCPVAWEAWEAGGDPPPDMKMRIPVSGANFRPPPTTGPPKAKVPGGQAARAAVPPPPVPEMDSRLPAADTPPRPADRRASTPPTRSAAPRGSLATSERQPVSNPRHPVLQALQVVQQGLQSLQALQTQTAEAHQKFLDTQQQAGRALQALLENSRRLAEFALGDDTSPGAGPAALSPEEPAASAAGPAASVQAPPDEPPAVRNERPPSNPVAVRHSAAAAPSPRPGQDADAEAVDSDDAVALVLREVVSELTGYPVEMLALEMQIESDLGIDSIKRVEILSRIEERLPSLPPLTPDRVAEFRTLGDVAAHLAGMPSEAAHSAAASGTASGAPDPGDPAPHEPAAILLEVVSELTGYPAAMLRMEMDVEADLGIDSIKRVEILSTLEDRMADFPAVAPDEMAELKTLGQIAARLEAGRGRSEAPGTDAAPAPQAPPATDIDAVTAVLTAVISDLTGYPAAMLSADMDIEADLGIDSIKRVEILSAMEDRLASLPVIAPEDMAGLKTIGQIAAALTGGASAPPPNSADGAPAVPPSSLIAAPAAATPPPLVRRMLKAVDAPLPAGPRLALPKHRKIFITTDKTGLSHALADQLSAGGLHTVQISVDILKHRRNLPEAAGLILLCDTDYDGEDAARRLKDFLANAFDLIRHLGPSLRASAAEGGALLATVSRMDGAFGVENLQGRHPYQGGLAGFAKTAAIEWPEVACRALDIDAGWQDNPAIARKVVEELLGTMPVPSIETGFKRNRRIVLELQPEPVKDISLSSLALEDGDVVVVSGGARGVTAAAAEALCRLKPLTLVLLGRSPMPFEEPEWLAGRAGEADLKKAIVAHEFAAARPTPQAVENAYRRYVGNREIRETLARIAAAGAHVRYVSLDIREADKVHAVLKDVRLVHGPIKALIHGAGVLRDRLILDKTADEFREVFGTKVDGLENLLAATREDPLRYIVLFSSVAARFGNIGQVDYAVANEVLNKVAAALTAERQGCTVRAINWGPWDGGMVTPSLRKAFTARQIALIPMELGAQAFVAEMTGDENGGVEVVIGPDLPAATQTRSDGAASAETVRDAARTDTGLSTAFISELNLQHYPILDHHRLDGKPVVPFALMAEWFGHGALHDNPGLRLAGIDGMRLLKGIVLDDRQRPVRVLAGSAKRNGDGVHVQLELRDGIAAGSEVVHSRATALLTDRPPSPPPFEIPRALLEGRYDREPAEIYADILFHGQDLQAILQVKACNASGMLADLATAPDPARWILKPPRNRWVADPLVLDGAFQMASLWCYEETGQVSLPSYSAAYRQYCRRFPSHPIQAVLEIKDVSRHKIIGDFTFLDRDGTVLAAVTGYEAVMEDRLMRAFKPERQASMR